MSVANLLHQAATWFPDRPAISWRSTSIDYTRFERRVRGFGGWLGETGVAPGGRVVLYLDNCPDLLVAMFGTFWAGSTVVPTNSRLTEDELAFLIRDGDTRIVGPTRPTTRSPGVRRVPRSLPASRVSRSSSRGRT